MESLAQLFGTKEVMINGEGVREVTPPWGLTHAHAQTMEEACRWLVQYDSWYTPTLQGEK